MKVLLRGATEKKHRIWLDLYLFSVKTSVVSISAGDWAAP